MIKYENGKIEGRGGKVPDFTNWHPDIGWHKLIKRKHNYHLVDHIYLNIKPQKSDGASQNG